MKTTIIDGQEYRLISIKPQKKDTFLFTLTMPNCGSWNGKWTGEGRVYAIAKKAFRRGKEIYPLCKEGNYYHGWNDGWGANVEAKLVTPREAKEVMKKSKGFAGYDWMVDNILMTGKIKDN